jgi:hypothetical protein
VKIEIAIADPDRVRWMVPLSDRMSILENEKDNFERCLMLSSDLWVGIVNEELICFWGLAPSTLLSNSAHLWLYTVEALKKHEFVFVRKSQLVVEAMLDLYPTITGYTDRRRSKAIRWLKWLGAEFGHPEGDDIPFVIRRRTH